MSTTNEPLIQAIAYLGGVKATADHFGLGRQAVWTWKKRGIPPKHVLTLVELVDHQVRAEELRPDIFTLEHAVVAGVKRD